MKKQNQKLNFIEKMLWFFSGTTSWLFGLIIYEEFKYSDLERHKEINSYLIWGIRLGTILYLLTFILSILAKLNK